MEKYYTPDIEEFHVGFEFETPTKDNVLYSVDSNIWEKKTVSIKSCMEKLKYDIMYGARVKYLDTNDIESLGFKKSGLGSDKTTLKMFSGEGKELKGYWITHHFANQETEIVDTRLEFHLMKFSGKIKNKSELKKVLKMIGYE